MENGPQIKPSERIVTTVELIRAGQAPEVVTIEFDGQVHRPTIAAKIAAVLELEAAEILNELSKPEVLHPEKHRGSLHLACIDLRFETEERKHHFLPRAKWERVHQWGCHKFHVATDACANLELHSGSPEGAVLNESKEIGQHEGCMVVWLVKPGPEKNG
jgi:hypothetical protein